MSLVRSDKSDAEARCNLRSSSSPVLMFALLESGGD